MIQERVQSLVVQVAGSRKNGRLQGMFAFPGYEAEELKGVMEPKE